VQKLWLSRGNGLLSHCPSQPNVPTAKAKQMHLTWNPLGFLSDLSKHKSETRFPPDV